MKASFFFILAGLIGAMVLKANAQATNKFSIEFLPGGALTLPSRLCIHQDNEPDIVLRAHYSTRSFTLPVYYSYRIGYHFAQKQSIEIEFNHLKINLENTTDEVQSFSVSHGYNQFWVSYVRDLKGFSCKAGLGPVLGHPENTVRNKELPGNLGLWGKGYYLNGITSQLAIQKRLLIGCHFFLSAETKLNLAYANVAVADGYAETPLCAFHGLLGFGAAF